MIVWLIEHQWTHRNNLELMLFKEQALPKLHHIIALVATVVCWSERLEALHLLMFMQGPLCTGLLGYWIGNKCQVHEDQVFHHLQYSCEEP